MATAATAPSEAPACPACQSATPRVWGSRSGLPVLECNNCGVIFFDRTAVKATTYGHYYEYTADWDQERVSWEVEIRRAKFRKQLARLAGYTAGRTLLDIGAGPGYYCRVAGEEGWDASGVEISENAIEVGRRFLGVKYVRLEEVPSATADVITCHHVLEHVDSPLELVTLLRDKLFVGGVIAVHVPHRECLSFQIRNKLGVVPTKGERLCALYAPEHLTGFTPQSLEALFARTGFTTLKLRTASMWSSYYDPFFIRNYIRRGDYSGILKHAVRSSIDCFGVALNRGEWIVGHFRKW